MLGQCIFTLLEELCEYFPTYRFSVDSKRLLSTLLYAIEPAISFVRVNLIPESLSLLYKLRNIFLIVKFLNCTYLKCQSDFSFIFRKKSRSRPQSSLTTNKTSWIVYCDLDYIGARYKGFIFYPFIWGVQSIQGSENIVGSNCFAFVFVQ